MSTDDRVHLHLDDHPQALAILAALFAQRPERAVDIGYESTEHGAWVEWSTLGHSWLSSTERAAVVIAHGVALAERQGGWAHGLHSVLVEAIERTGTGPPR
jgi:hypothetical protein